MFFEKKWGMESLERTSFDMIKSTKCFLKEVFERARQIDVWGGMSVHRKDTQRWNIGTCCLDIIPSQAQFLTPASLCLLFK